MSETELGKFGNTPGMASTSKCASLVGQWRSVSYSALRYAEANRAHKFPVCSSCIWFLLERKLPKLVTKTTRYVWETPVSWRSLNDEK